MANIPVVAATPNPGEVPVPVSETTLVNHLAAMENRLGLKMDRTEEKVDKNTSDLQELRERVNKNDAGLYDRIIKVVCGLSGVGPPPGASGLSGPGPSSMGDIDDVDILQRLPFSASQADRWERKFMEARRSLRLWPVPGPDLGTGLHGFLQDRLKLDKGFIENLGLLKVERHYDPRSKNKKKDEALVKFRNKETRDVVRAAAPNLAGHGNSVGLRMQVPGHLLTNFKALENLGYQMRRVRQDVRCVIKFDDDAQDVIMYVKIGDEWKRVRPGDALRAKRNNPSLVSGPVNMSVENITDFFAPASAPSMDETS